MLADNSYPRQERINMASAGTVRVWAQLDSETKLSATIIGTAGGKRRIAVLYLTVFEVQERTYSASHAKAGQRYTWTTWIAESMSLAKGANYESQLLDAERIIDAVRDEFCPALVGDEGAIDAIDALIAEDDGDSW